MRIKNNFHADLSRDAVLKWTVFCMARGRPVVIWPFMEVLLCKQFFSLSRNRVIILSDLCRTCVGFASNSLRNRSGIVPESFRNRVGIVSYTLLKSPLSVGGVHTFWFLNHLAVMKDKKTALEMAWWPRYENLINNKMHCWWHGGENGIQKLSYLGLQVVSQSENLTQCYLVCLQGRHTVALLWEFTSHCHETPWRALPKRSNGFSQLIQGFWANSGRTLAADSLKTSHLRRW